MQEKCTQKHAANANVVSHGDQHCLANYSACCPLDSRSVSPTIASGERVVDTMREIDRYRFVIYMLERTDTANCGGKTFT